ncbi:MAG: hypothetical protein JWP75_1867, partial [Frondihabitans sp.]|nr:hypothetical protein [Frondihabitans sp.]
PDGFDAPIDLIEVDLKVGGHWNLTMREVATGALFPITGTITQLVPNEYLEMSADSETGSGDLNDLGLRITFHDHGQKTRVTLHQGEFTDEQKEETAVGWEMSWVKLDGLLG